MYKRQPLDLTKFKPATFPERASVQFDATASVNCVLSILVTEYPKDFSSLLIPKAVTTTSLKLLVEDFNRTLTPVFEAVIALLATV